MPLLLRSISVLSLIFSLSFSSISQAEPTANATKIYRQAIVLANQNTSPEQDQQALKLLEQALMQDTYFERGELAYMIAVGRGTNADENRAIELLRYDGISRAKATLQLAEIFSSRPIQLHRRATQYNLNILKDDARAFRLYQQVLQGNHESEPVIFKALFQTGIAYKYGLGIAQNDVKAIEFLEESLVDSTLESLAIKELVEIYLESAQVEQGISKALALLSEQNNRTKALEQIANLYLKGSDYVMRDPFSALDWLHLAADENSYFAMLKLGQLYATGEGTDKDIVTAMNWLKKVFESRDDNAQPFVIQAGYELAKLSLQNEQFDNHQVLAYQWLLKTFEKSQALATTVSARTYTNLTKLELAKMYINGIGTEANTSQAMKLLETFEENIVNGAYLTDDISKEAMYLLAHLYMESAENDSEGQYQAIKLLEHLCIPLIGIQYRDACTLLNLPSE